MAAAMALGGFTGPEADTLGYAIRKKKSSVLRAQKEKFVTPGRGAGCRAWRDRRGLHGLRAVRALRVQQGPRHLLRPHRLPDRLPEGEPHGRLHDRRPHGVPGERGEGRGGGRRVPPDGHRGAAAGRPRQPSRVHRRGRRDPVRAAGRQERRPGRDRVDHRGPRRGRRVPLADRLLYADRPSIGQPQGARGAHQGRRAQRLRPSGAAAARARRRDRFGAGDPARPDHRPDVAVRHGCGRCARVRAAASGDDRGPRPRAPALGEGAARACTCRSTRWARWPSRSAGSSTPTRATSGTSRSTGSGSWSAAS